MSSPRSAESEGHGAACKWLQPRLPTSISLLVCPSEPEEPVDPRFPSPVVPGHGSALINDLNIFMTLST